MRVVLDTNIIVATILSPNGFAAKIMQLVEADAIQMVVSEAILTEYEETLNEPDIQVRHKLRPVSISERIAGLRKVAYIVEPDFTLDVVKNDKDDNMFVECAVAGNAGFIVSRDPHLLSIGSYEGIQILPPHIFMEHLAAPEAA